MSILEMRERWVLYRYRGTAGVPRQSLEMSDDTWTPWKKKTGVGPVVVTVEPGDLPELGTLPGVGDLHAEDKRVRGAEGTARGARAIWKIWTTWGMPWMTCTSPEAGEVLALGQRARIKRRG